MKKIYLVFSETKDGKNFAHAETIRAGENLRNYIERYPLAKIVHICESATQAAYLAEEWNESYKQNGTYMYDLGILIETRRKGKDEIIRVDIIDNDESYEDRLQGTYYLKNPDESKLKELKRMIENRFEESNEFSDSYLAVVNFIEENFETVEIETKVINW